MHSSETGAAAGPALLLELGRLMVRARERSPQPAPRLKHKHKPGTSHQVHIQTQPRVEEEDARLEAHLTNHVNALWTDHVPVCVEVLLAPECGECFAALSASHAEDLVLQRGLLLERWSMRALTDKSEGGAVISPPWLVNAVRSQLHFSQLAAWRVRLQPRDHPRRRKLSREQCNFKKIEANSDEPNERKLNIVYSIRTPGDYKITEFAKPASEHVFPVTDLGDGTFLQVVVESLPRLEDIPHLTCHCHRRRPSKDFAGAHEELLGKLNDLTIGSRNNGAINSNIGTPSRRLSIISNPGSTEYLFVEKDVVDDRMHTSCSASGKHRCSCDDESDGALAPAPPSGTQPSKLDERRLKEIAKYKRRIRKEKLKKFCDSTSSEGDVKKETTSIPILQASRFDRFRAIGCYRNQTYLTLPATRIETKSPFIETDNITPPEYKKTNTVATQTDDFNCTCGNPLDTRCDECKRMVRSEGNYDLASLQQSSGARPHPLNKHKCDNNITRDSVHSFNDGIIKRPKLRRLFPIVDRLGKIVTDRTEKGLADNQESQNTETDMRELHLKKDDSVFAPKESKRQKTFSISDEDYILYEKCDYGTIDKHEVESPKEERPDFTFAAPELGEDGGGEDLPSFKDEFVFGSPRRSEAGGGVPTSSEVDGFRWRLDSAASMVFHTRTGLPLTSSPAPLRRTNNCFDFDDTINGISGIKSALFHPISPVSPVAPASPASPAPTLAPRAPRRSRAKLRIGPSTGLLGSFEECALQGRLEAVATVHGFTAELAASGAFCPPHRRLPVTVFFYAPGGTSAPYMGHINLGSGGYRVARSGTVQVSLFNPHGTLVKMFVVLYDLSCMPPAARTFLRQRTLYMPAGAPPPAPAHPAYLRYLIHLRFMTSKSGKLYLHTDIRLIVSRKADLDTATAHVFRPLPKAGDSGDCSRGVVERGAPNRVFGGSSTCATDAEKSPEICYDSASLSYELRSFTYAPDNPRYSPR